jgi:hypothetical protein
VSGAQTLTGAKVWLSLSRHRHSDGDAEAEEGVLDPKKMGSRTHIKGVKVADRGVDEAQEGVAARPVGRLGRER